MKLLNLIGSLDPRDGGPVEALESQSRSLPALGHEMAIVSHDDPAQAWLSRFSCPVHAIGPSQFGRYGYNRTLDRWLLQHGHAYDAIIVHGLWQYNGLAVRRAAKRLYKPYFIVPHGTLDPWFKRRYPVKHLKKWLYWPWAEYRVLRDADGVFFSTEEEMRLAPQSFWLYRARSVITGFGITDTARPGVRERGAWQQAFPKLHGLRFILFLGRLHPKKGCDLLIEAFGDIAVDHPDLHLVMAGPDQIGWSAELRKMTQILGIASRVHWTGLLEGPVKNGALRAAEALALPSHSENFGMVVPEAMSSGVPVLISDKVNIWKTVRENGAGLVAADSREGCAAMLRQWLNLPAEAREAMRQRARTCYERHFGIDQFLINYVALIEQMSRPRTLAPRSAAGDIDTISG